MMYKDQVIGIAVVVIVLVIFLVCLFALKNYQCHAQGRLATKVTDVKWGIVEGCFWQVDGDWIPADRYRTVNDD